jgi:hypothetical protein
LNCYGWLDKPKRKRENTGKRAGRDDKKRGFNMICDSCANYMIDEEDGTGLCGMDMDEDEVYRFYTSAKDECPYYRLDDEYAVVRHQM